MPQITEFGDGVRTKYPLPIHNKAATATVNGGNATISSQDDQSVTFAVAPAAGSVVVITYTEVNTKDRRATASLAAVNQAASIDAGGAAVVAVQITGTFSATVTFEGTLDGANWLVTPAVRVDTGATTTTTTTAGLFQVDAAGFALVRARVSAFTSGSVNATLAASAATGVVSVDNALPTGSNTIGTVILGNSANGIGFVGLAATLGALYTTNLAAAASGNTTALDATANPVRSQFNASLFTDKLGLLTIEASADNTTFREVARLVTAANQGATLSVPVVQRYYRARFLNNDAAITTVMWLGTSLTSD